MNSATRFPVGHALGRQAGDLQLLRRELVDRGLIPPPDGLPRRPQLAASELAPGRGAEQVECLDGGAKLAAMVM